MKTDDFHYQVRLYIRKIMKDVRYFLTYEQAKDYVDKLSNESINALLETLENNKG